MVGKLATTIIGVLWGGSHVLADPVDVLSSCRENYESLKLEAAVEDCTAVLMTHERRSPQRLEALVVRGLTQFDLGRLDLALADLTTALQLDPGNPVVLHHRANVFNELALIEHALRDYTAALAIDPFYAEAYINRAIAHKRAGSLNLAQEDAATAHLLKPEDPRIATVRRWLEPGS